MPTQINPSLDGPSADGVALDALSLDRLADPNPPAPGAPTRAAVNARASTLARRRRLAQGGGVLACVVVLSAGVVALATSGSEGPARTANVGLADRPETGTRSTSTPSLATTTPAAVATSGPDAAPDTAAAAATPDTSSAPPATAATAPAALTVTVDASASSGIPADVNLQVTLVGTNGTFQASTRTPGTLSFGAVPPGDYELRWQWASDDGSASAVGRIPVTVGDGATSFSIHA